MLAKDLRLIFSIHIRRLTATSNALFWLPQVLHPSPQPCPQPHGHNKNKPLQNFSVLGGGTAHAKVHVWRPESAFSFYHVAESNICHTISQILNPGS